MNGYFAVAVRIFCNNEPFICRNWHVAVPLHGARLRHLRGFLRPVMDVHTQRRWYSASWGAEAIAFPPDDLNYKS